MITEPQYIIMAGTNGAGKSTLYDTLSTLFTKTKQINTDEILKQMGGNWRKNLDNLKATREAIKQPHAVFDHGQHIHVETTLADQGKGQLNLIDHAHKSGFEITLLYVTVKDADLAIKRVHEWVEKGGQDISDEVVKMRYR